MRPLLLAALLAALLAPLLTRAAPPAPAPVHFVSAVALAEMPTGLFFLDGDTPLPVEVPLRTRSSPAALAAAGPLRLYETTLDAQGRPGRRLLATIPLPSPSGRWLLLLAPAPSDTPGEPWRARVLDDDLARFPAGSVRVFNFTSRPLACRLATADFTVNAGAELVVPAPTPEPGRPLAFQLAARDSDSAPWRRLRATGLEVGPGQRAAVIAFPDPRRPGAIGTLVLRDKPSAPPTPTS